MSTQQTAPPWMGWAVVVLSMILVVYLAAVWSIQGRALPNATSAVGGSIELPSDLYAIAILFNDDHKSLIFEATGVVDNSIALRTDGSVVPGSEHTVSMPRPSGWFWPNTVGVAYMREGDRSVVRRIKATSTGLEVSAPHERPIQVPIHPDTSFGTHCIDNCELEGLAELTIENIDVLVIGNEKIMATTAQNKANLLEFAVESAKLRNPVEQTRRTLDGNLITELIPSETIKDSPVDTGKGTFRIGGEQFGWFYISENALPDQSNILISTSIELLETYSDSLSTKPWTNKVCGKKPASFYRQDNSQGLAENTNNQLTLVRTSRTWLLCQE